MLGKETLQKNIRSIARAVTCEPFTGDRFIVLLAGSLVLAILARFYLSTMWCVGILCAWIPGLFLCRMRRRVMALFICFALGLICCHCALAPLRLASEQREREVELCGIVTQIEPREDGQTRLTLEHVLIDAEALPGTYSLWLEEDAVVPERLTKITATCALAVKNFYGNIGSDYLLANNTRNGSWIYFSDVQELSAEYCTPSLLLRARVFVQDILQRIRTRIYHAVIRHVSSSRSAALCYGMLVGDSSYVDEQTYETFRDGGILHLLAVSGLHVGAAAAVLAILVARIPAPSWLRILFACILVWFYVAICGVPVSAQRAAVMFAISLAAPQMLRRADGLCSLAAACLCILLFDPLAVFSVGFRLSFCATGAIVLLGSDLTACFEKLLLRVHIPCAKAIGTALGISLAAQLGVTPCLLSTFGNAPLASFVLNPIIVPAAGILLASSWLTVFADLIGFGAGIIGQFTSFIFEMVVSITQWGTQIFGDLTAPFWVNAWLRILFFVLLFCLSSYCTLAIRGKRVVCTIVCAALIASGVGCWIGEKTQKAITMFDVGQGQCVLLESRGKHVLVDCGTNPYGGISASALASALVRSGAAHLDAVIVSHADADHMNLTAELTQLLDVDCIICSQQAGQQLSDVTVNDFVGMQEEYLRELEESGIEVIAGEGTENEDSLIVAADFGNMRCLLMGDAQQAAEEALLENGIENFDVLVVGHHGSDTSSSRDFIRAVWPRIALISVGRNNLYEHPHEQTLRRLRDVKAQIYRTDENGMIRIRTRNGAVATFYSRHDPVEGGAAG
jgi:competence protein ComEC